MEFFIIYSNIIEITLISIYIYTMYIVYFHVFIYAKYVCVLENHKYFIYYHSINTIYLFNVIFIVSTFFVGYINKLFRFDCNC